MNSSEAHDSNYLQSKMFLSLTAMFDAIFLKQHFRLNTSKSPYSQEYLVWCEQSHS